VHLYTLCIYSYQICIQIDRYRCDTLHCDMLGARGGRGLIALEPDPKRKSQARLEETKELLSLVLQHSCPSAYKLHNCVKSLVS